MSTTSPKPFCFVLMPFSREFDDVYKIGIKETCDSVGTYCERVDEQVFDGRILDRIYNQIAKADLVIADMTAKNPNVFYEVGYAHALGKRTILLTKTSDDIPFDLKHFPHIVYGNSLVDLREQLTKKLQWFAANPEKSQTQIRDPYQLFVSNQALGGDVIEYLWSPETEYPHITVVVQNISGSTIPAGKLKVVFLFSPFGKQRFTIVGKATSVDLPTKEKQVSAEDLPDLLPGECHEVSVAWQDDHNNRDVELRVRAYSELGPKDYKVSVKPRERQPRH